MNAKTYLHVRLEKSDCNGRDLIKSIIGTDSSKADFDQTEIFFVLMQSNEGCNGLCYNLL